MGDGLGRAAAAGGACTGAVGLPLLIGVMSGIC